LITFDDPYRHEFERLAELGLMDLRILPAVSCEAVAQHAFEHVGKIVSADTKGRVWVESVEVSEHGGNSAMYREEFPESEPSH
jgi:6-pyruvoyltetrahydropterin/6-carboxytetrahydropterin synthase